MQIKYAVKDLDYGMYVSELDRPWDETPFLFQGFMIKSKDELATLRETCKFVHVDDLKSSLNDAVQEKLHAALPGDVLAATKSRDWPGAQGLRSAIEKIEVDATAVVNYLKGLVRTGPGYYEPLAGDMRRAVNHMIDGIAADPHAGAWLRLLGGQDKDDSRSGINTAVLAVGFARHIGWDAELQRVVGQGAIFHDVGLMKVSKEIRKKSEPLTKLERRVLEYHPNYGVQLLEGIGGMDERVIKIVKQHHEHLDGSGYPDHIFGTAIALYAQLVSLCDIYNTCTTNRPSRDAPSPSDTLNDLLQHAGVYFDTELTEQFIGYIGIYPLGSLVRLHNGTLAVVVATNEKHRLRPTVLLIRNTEGSQILPPRTLNLETAEQIGKFQEWRVESICDPVSEGVDVATVLRRELVRL